MNALVRLSMYLAVGGLPLALTGWSGALPPLPPPSPVAASVAPPLECGDAVTLRTVAAGVYFRGAPPEGFRLDPDGLRNPETGEELPIRVETSEGTEEAAVRIREAEIHFRQIRTTGETPDGWRCAAEFVLRTGDRRVQGEVTYTSEVDGLEYRDGGQIQIEGVELSF